VTGHVLVTKVAKITKDFVVFVIVVGLPSTVAVAD
jgi:hypothetical protein